MASAGAFSMLGLEIVFRTALPACQSPWALFDVDAQILRYDADLGSDGVYTRGRFAHQRARWHINAAGWNSDVEYLPRSARARPLVAVVGDSYVEALSVDVDASAPAVLRRRLGERADVYAFGFAGAPLSHYLQMSRYVGERYDPSILVISVVHNDFTESLTTQHPHGHFMQLRPTPSGFVEEPARPFAPDPWRRLIKRSAVARYLWINSGLLYALRPRASGEAQGRDRFEARDVAEAERAEIEAAVAYVADRLRAEHPGRELVLMVDGPRRDIYAGTLATSPVRWMNALVAREGARIGARVLDLSDRFAAEHGRGAELHRADDYHWNETAHALIADELHDLLLELLDERSAIASAG